MPPLAQQQPESLQRASAQTSLRAILLRRRFAATLCRRVLFAAFASFLAVRLFSGVALAAQTAATPAPAPRATKPAAHSAAHPISHPIAHRAAHSRARAHRKPQAAKPAIAIAAPAPAAPVAPPTPNWPANDKPVEATVVWDSHGLFIQASNSSLDEILKDVSLKTGAKVEGIGTDERIFGIYGPGPARDVLYQLLDGSGYNILIVGDQAAGMPLRIVLSGRPTGPAPSTGNTNPIANNNDSDNEQDFDPNPAAQMPPFPGDVAPGMPIRQQLLEEREQQIRQAQQQQQNNSQDSQN